MRLNGTLTIGSADWGAAFRTGVLGAGSTGPEGASLRTTVRGESPIRNGDAPGGITAGARGVRTAARVAIGVRAVGAAGGDATMGSRGAGGAVGDVTTDARWAGGAAGATTAFSRWAGDAAGGGTTLPGASARR
jgi:hypothetical protein